MKKRIFALFSALAMALTLLPGTVFATSESVTLDISAGSIVITETGYTFGGAAEETPFTGSYTIAQSDPSPTAHTISVVSGAADITFTKKTNIDVSSTTDACAFSVAAGASATITLSNAVILKSGKNCAGLQVPTGAAVTLRASRPYWSLDVTGGELGAGIGGGFQKSAGNITIESGKITANAGGGAAGIGGGGTYGTGSSSSFGAGTGTGETIHITGTARVEASGKGGGSGIGGGYRAPGTGEGGTIRIDGTASVTANGLGGAGIGGGTYSYSDDPVHGTGKNGTILITGQATVVANGGAESAGIGGGEYGNGTGVGGSITISGDAVVTATGGTGGFGSQSDPHRSGAGIGGGHNGTGTGTDGAITVTDRASVTALSPHWVAIGGDYGTGTRGKILISGSARVEATGLYRGIGGSHNSYATGEYGAINISGGTVIATANHTTALNYSGIGGKTSGYYGSVNITGGYVTAKGPYGMTAANLYGGTVTAISTYSSATSGFSTAPTVPNGSYPWVFASPSCGEQDSGVFFSGTEGVMYGDFYLTEQDQEIPTGHTLTVKAGQTLVVTEGTTLTVNGKLVIEGELYVDDENGLILGEGASLEGNIPHEHDLHPFSAREATCTDPGCIAHWRCSYCGKYFADSAAAEELTADEVILPALGHSFDHGTCGNCGISITEAALLVATVTGAPGQTVKVPLTLVNNPGIISAKIQITFDADRLELVGAEDGGLLEGAVFGNSYTSPYVLTWENGERTENISADGVIATLTFRVKSNSPVGPAAITAVISDTVSATLGSVPFTATNGAVNVSEYLLGDANGDGAVTLLDAAVMRRYIARWTDVTVNEAAADVDGDGAVTLTDVVILRRALAGWKGYDLPYTPSQTSSVQSFAPMSTGGQAGVFSVTNSVANPGDLVILDVVLSDNPGIIAALLKLDYDPNQLELVSAKDCQLLDQAVFGDRSTAVPYVLSWENGTATEDTTDNGMVATLTFRVKEGCSNAEVSVTVTEAFDAGLNPVSFRTVSGTVYNLDASYDAASGQLSLSELPDGVLSYAAAYRDGQMVWCGLPSEAASIPAGADTLKVMFVNPDWSPAGPCKTFDL